MSSSPALFAYLIVHVRKIATDRSPPLRPARTLLLWLVLSCWLPAMLGIATLFFHMYDAGRTQVEKSTVETARALIQVVDGELMRAQAVALALATSDELAQRDFGGLRRRTAILLKATGVGTSIVLSDESGQQIFSTLFAPNENLPGSVNLPHIQRVVATGEPQVSNLFRGGVTGRLLFTIGVPIRIDGKLAYVLSLGIAARDLNPVLLRQQLPADWVASVIDGAGTIVARTRGADQHVGKPAPPELMRHLMTAATPEGSIDATTMDGVASLVSYSRSARSQWSVAIAVPHQQVEAALLRTVYLLILVVAILFGASAALAWVLGGRISRSVRALTGPANTLEAGGPIAPIAQVYFREADEVAKAMARTAVLLVQRTHALNMTREALEQREKYFRTIMGSVMDAIVVLDESGHIMYINHAPPGFSAVQLLGSEWTRWLDPVNRAAAEQQMRQTFASHASSVMEVSATGFDGAKRAFQINFSAIPGHRQVVLIARDISDIKQAGAALLSSRTGLRKLVEHQELIREYERRRIARDVHDDLGQNLLVLRIDLSMMATRADLDALSAHQVGATLKQIDITIRAVKDIINDLRPAVLSLGLHAAIEWQARQFERRTGIACAFSYDSDEFALDDKHATSLFRIVQESLTNIVRHANARHAQIDIACRDGQLFMSISDDGIGLAVDWQRRDNAFGLAGIEERIDALGGTFSFTNHRPHGAALMVSIPFAIDTVDALCLQTRRHRPPQSTPGAAPGMVDDACAAALPP